MYAYFKKLTYFSTECIYSPDGTFPFTLQPYSSSSSVPVFPLLDSRYASRLGKISRGVRGMDANVHSVQGTCKSLSQGSGGDKTIGNHRYHPFWRIVCPGTKRPKGNESHA